MPALSLVARLQQAVDRALYAWARPLAPRLSARTVDLAARLLAVPASLLVFATSPRETRAFLEQVGHPSGVLGRLAFSYRKALSRFHDNYVYLRPDDPVLRGPGMVSLDERGETAVLVGWNTAGVVGAATLAAERGDRIIRIPYGGEDGPSPEEVRPSERWAAHTAAVRTERIGPHQLVPGCSPIAYIRALRGGHSLVVLQDVPDPDGDAPLRTLLGVERPLPVGAVRLAAAGRVPIYIVTFSFRAGRLWVDAQGPVEPDEQAVLDHISAGIRRAPWAWMLWREFLPDPAQVPATARRGEGTQVDQRGLVMDALSQ